MYGKKGPKVVKGNIDAANAAVNGKINPFQSQILKYSWSKTQLGPSLS